MLRQLIARLALSCIVVALVVKTWPSIRHLVLATYTVESFGAIPNDGLSDSQAFRDAFAAACDDTLPAIVTAGAGTWFLPRIDNRSAVYILGCTDVTFQGVASTLACGSQACTGSPSTTILQGSVGALSGDYMLFATDGGGGLDFADFACDGRKASISGADEQTHCIEIKGTDDTSITRVYFHDMWGDSVKFVTGVGAAIPDTFVVTDTWHKDNGRSGLAFNGGNDGLITNLTSSGISDQSIDMEPGDFLSNITIRNCYLGTPSSNGAATLSLSGAVSPTTNILVQNVVAMGGVHGVAMDGITLDNVLVIADNTGRVGIEFQGQADNITIRDSAISANGIFDAIKFGANVSAGASNVTIERVRLTADTGVGLDYVGGAGPLTVTNLKVRSQNAARNVGGTGIRIATEQATPVLDNVALTGVDVRGMQNGIVVSKGSGAADIDDCTFSGVVDLDDVQAATIGAICSAAGLCTISGLTITADTASSGC